MTNLSYVGNSEGLMEYLDNEAEKLEMERQEGLADLQRDNDLGR